MYIDYYQRKFGNDSEVHSFALQADTRSGSGCYGKVTGKEVAELLTQLTGTEIDKKKVELPSAIKEFGSYDAAVRLYAGVVAPFKLKVEEL